MVLTNSLPNSYQPLIVSLELIEESKLTVDYVISRLTNEEDLQRKEVNNESLQAGHRYPARVAASGGVRMLHGSYPGRVQGERRAGYSDYTEWGTCCTRATNGHLHGSCTTCTLPRTQFRYDTYPAAGLRPGTRATHDTYTVRVRLSLDLVFF